MKKILVLQPTIAIDWEWLLKLYNELGKNFEITIITPLEIWLPRFWLKKKTLDLAHIKKNYPNITVIWLSVFHPTNQFLQTIYSKLFRTLKKIKPDIIHCYTEIFSPILSQIVFYKKVFNKNVKIVNYSTENLDWSHRFPHALFGWFNAKSINKVWCLNHEAIREVQKFWVHKKDIVYFGLGIDFSNFKFIHHTLEWKKKFTLGFIWRIVKEKGIINLLEVLLHLGENYNAQILWTWPDDNYFKEFVHQNWLENQVQFVWSVPYPNLHTYFENFDILVVPSLSTKDWKEQFGRVIAESMASWVPVIWSSSWAIPEVIGNRGLVFQEGNSVDLAEKITFLCKHKKIYSDFSQKWYDFAAKNYTQEAFLNNLDKVYKSM